MTKPPTIAAVVTSPARRPACCVPCLVTGLGQPMRRPLAFAASWRRDGDQGKAPETRVRTVRRAASGTTMTLTQRATGVNAQVGLAFAACPGTSTPPPRSRCTRSPGRPCRPPSRTAGPTPIAPIARAAGPGSARRRARGGGGRDRRAPGRGDLHFLRYDGHPPGRPRRAWRARRRTGRRLLVSAVEHSSLLAAARMHKTPAASSTPSASTGRPGRPDGVRRALRPDTALACLQRPTTRSAPFSRSPSRRRLP